MAKPIELDAELVAELDDERRRRTLKSIQKMIRNMNTLYDWKLSEEVLKNTPDRILRFYDEWSTYGDFNFTMFPSSGTDQLVISSAIHFHSLCEHHFLPFHGKAAIGYLPTSEICGISKLSRTIQFKASRPTTQEYLTEELASYLEEQLQPRFLMVVLKAQHECMTIRGVKQPESIMTTSAIRHTDADWKSLKAEFLDLIRGELEVRC